MEVLDRHSKTPVPLQKRVGTAVTCRAEKWGRSVVIAGSTGVASLLSGPDKKLTGQIIFDITTQMRVRDSHFTSHGSFLHTVTTERAANWRRHHRKELNCQPENG